MVFVNNGCDRNLRNKIFFKTIFYSSYTISHFPQTDRALLTYSFSKTAMSFCCEVGYECSVLHYLLWFGSCVCTGSIITSWWTKMSSLTHFLRVNQCQTAQSDLHWLKVILALKTSREFYQPIMRFTYRLNQFSVGIVKEITISPAYTYSIYSVFQILVLCQ